MIEPSLSGVKPLRITETRRRLKVIRRYLAQEVPTAASRVEAAASLGMGQEQFMNLVRAWKLQKSAAAIAKAGAKAGQPRKPRAGGLPTATREAAEEALRKLPATARHREAIEAVRIKCEARGTRPPSDSMVSYLRLSVRGSGDTATGAPGLVIGRATARLPVLDGGRMTLPELAMAVRNDDGVVLLAAIIPDGGDAAGFRSAATGLDTPGQGNVKVGADDADAASGLPGAEVISRFTAGRLLAKAIGRGVGPIPLSYGPLASRDPGRLLRARADAPLTPDEAADAIAQALAAHNAARGSPPPRLVNEPDPSVR